MIPLAIRTGKSHSKSDSTFLVKNVFFLLPQHHVLRFAAGYADKDCFSLYSHITLEDLSLNANTVATLIPPFFSEGPRAVWQDKVFVLISIGAAFTSN